MRDTEREFFQNGPTLGNQYDDDPVLRYYLARILPESVLVDIEPDLRRLGERAVTDVLHLGNAAEASPPRHIPYDAWGKRVDYIEVSDAWKELDRISAKEKLVRIAYERRHGSFSRIHQFARVYLFSASSASYTCPLAMTDGAARAIELYGDETLKNSAFKRLTSSDPREFWTSGQWMTERTGGSDVSRVSTVARLEGGTYRLYGTKCFTSAATSQMAMTLARIEGAPEGNKGLSLFYLELRDPEGNLNNIFVHRLKDKLGTKALPTAELTLNGTSAILVGGEGDGIKKISAILNITRLWNACGAISLMRRGIALAENYASKREAFGRLLTESPLHVETLTSIEAEFRGAFSLIFRAAELLGKEETGEATAEESAILRLLTPIVKLYTAKQAIAALGETIECFGGAGYIEDTGIPRLLRDGHVLSIWEGTTNVLSLDVLQVMQKSDALRFLFADIERRIAGINSPEVREMTPVIRNAMSRLAKSLEILSGNSSELLEMNARSISYGLARVYAASLLLAEAEWNIEMRNDRKAFTAVKRWCAAGPWPFINTGPC